MAGPKTGNTNATPHHHRSTLSQSNKPFKARHATKGSLKQLAKGRLEKDSKNDHKPNKNSQSITGQKAARKNHAKQLQAEKTKAQNDAHRIFTGPNPAPRIITILALSEDIDPVSDVLLKFKHAAGLTDPIDFNSTTPHTFSWPSSSAKLSSGLLQFNIIPHLTPLPQLISAVIASDFIISALSAVEECTPWGESSLRAIQAIGGPSLGTLALVCHLDTLLGPKETHRTRESLASFMRYFFPDSLLLNRIISADAPEEVLVAARSILAKQPLSVLHGRPLGWREGRGRLVAEQIEWADDVLMVTGFVRGGRFSADRLVHLPFMGDYKLKMITMGDEQKEKEVKVTCLPTQESDDLVSENCPSETMNAEQTWPTEEEIASAPANQPNNTIKKKLRRVPVGTSEYQAAWILDVEDEDEDDQEEGSDIDQETTKDIIIDEQEDEEEEEEMEDLQTEPAGLSKEVQFMDLSEEAEQEGLNQFRTDRQRERDRAKEAKEDEEFPDEIDTPLDIPARQRFARYRGMKSLRTSEWDPYENLPLEYGKVFGFEGWKAMGKRLMQKANELEPGVAPGMRVTLHIDQFSRSDYERVTSNTVPLVIFSLLKHEHKYSVMHFSTQRSTEFEGEIRSKDPLIICVGFRFYKIEPIWSQASLRSTNKVHKFERYLRGGKMNIGSAYMPVTFGSTTPVLVFKENNDEIQFVGNGCLVGSDPQRIIAKRIILTGHPYKVHRKTATIRYMFFNREDIEYFKPIELKTKKGKTGYIKEALGTHGYFKAGFDSSIDQMDTICMSLYKRCYPKWSTLWKPTLKFQRIESIVQNSCMEIDGC